MKKITPDICFCSNCNKKFIPDIKKKSFIKKKNPSSIFCSDKCHKKYQGKDVLHFLCHNCQKPIVRTKSGRKKNKSGFFFCCKSCAASYNNSVREKTRRSKIEIQFFDLLVKEFPNLKILPNDKTMLEGLEVDIAIPELKLAIEWNGIVHFKPIYGETKLNKIKQN